MATTKMPVLSTRTDLEDMPVLSAKQPGTQKASPAAAPKVGGDISAEAWTRATPAQAKVPQSKKQGALLTKTENVAVGGSRGGRTVYRDVEMPTLAGRAVKVASSVGKSAASTFSDASRALYEAGQKGRTARDTELQGDIQTRLERAESDLSMMLEDNLKQPGTWTDQEVQSQRYVVEDAQRKVNALRQVSEGQVQQKATQKVNQLVDSLDESAAKDTQEAKRGLGKTGSAVVDIGTAGLQLAADRSVGTAMGIGTMPVVAMRVFGGGTKEARQSGATLGQQLTYGAASAAVSAATEQLSNVVKPFAKAFGAGVTDDVVEAAIGKAVERFAGTPAGKTALEGVLKSGAGFLGEGLEEFAEDVASPILKRMTYDPSAQFDLQEALYDFLIGGALGSLGGAVEGVTDAGGRYRGYQTKAAVEAVDSAYDTMREKGMFSQEARRAVRDAKDIMPKLYRGVTETELDRISPRLTDENGNWYDAEGREHSAGEQNGQASTSMGQETSMEDAAFESKTVPDHLGAVALLQKNLGDISSMQPVSVVTGQEVPKTGIATERAMAFLKNIGGKVERPGFGEVLFSKSKVKNSLLGHGFGEAKVELMAGVPGVIQHGKQIGFTENWKGRGYDSYVFAAPVQYRGENVYVTAIVIKDSANRYYLHEAVDQNGNMIFGQNKSSATASDGPAAKPQDTVAGSELSGNSIPQHQGKNNGKFEEPDIMPKLTMENGKATLGWAGGDELRAGFRDRATASEAYADSVPQGGVDVKNSEPTETAAKITEEQGPQATNKSVMPKTLRDLGIDPYGSEADYTGVENLAMQTSSLKTMRRRIQSEIQKIAATAKERSFARQVAAGQLDMEDIPGTVDRNTVEILSDYYRELNGRSETQPLQNRRNKILEAEMAKMEPLLGMDVAYDERGLERRMIPGEGRLSKAANAARDSFAKTFSTFRRNLQTPARICEFEWGREHGAKVYKTLFQPVVENNGRQVAWMNNMLDGVREFADSSGNKRKLTKKERAVVQQMVENGASENRVLQLKTDAENASAKAEKAKKAVERARSVGINDAEAVQRAEVLADEAKIAEYLWSAAENIQKGWTAEDAAREFGIDKSDQSFKDLENYSIYLKAKQELDNSADVDSRIVDTAVKAYSENYRKLYDAINTFLVGHGYDTIGFIQGYAPHLQPETQKTAFQKAMKMLGLNETAMDLPTSISGQTADLKPYKQYDPFFQTRNGSKTDFDIVRGFESYIQYLGNIFYHTDDIMRIRTAEKYLRKTYTNKEASEMISWAENARNFSAGEKLDFLKEYAGVEEDSDLSYQDASKLLEDYISKLYDQVGSISRYGELAKYLNNYANRLAGKQSELDRGVEYSLGRGALNWVNQMESKYGGAKIAFNVSSALNQTSQIPMVAVETGEKSTLTAMMEFINPTKRGKEERADFISRSNFLKGKAGVDWISEPETRSEKIREKGFAMSEAVDGFTSYVAVRGKYLQAVNEGKSSAEAMQIADEYGRRVMGSRAKGEKPMLFDTKNPFWQIATKFQLEVMNTWDHVFHDMPNDIKNTAKTEGKVSAARKLAGRIVKYEAYAFLLNAGFRALYGGTPIPFDLLGNALEGIADAMGLTMGETVKTLLDNVLESVLDERVFGTDDDDKDDEIDVGKGISSFLGNAANDMPLVGRAAALLGIGDQTLPMADFSKLGDLGTSIRKNGLISADTGEAALNVVSEFAYGGNQLRKTGQGLLALGRGGSYSGDKLRYPVERTPENLVKGTLFGKSSFDSADEYYAHGSKTLTERMTRAYEGLVDNGVNREVAYDLIQQIRAQKDTPQKLEVITESLLSDREKLQLCYDVVADKDDTWPDKLKKMMDAGLTWSEAAETYLEYLNLRDQEDMKATEQATRFAAWIDQSGVSSKQADIVEDTLKFFTQIPAEADRYTAMTEAGLDPGKAESLTMRISHLRPEAGKETVRDLQRYEVVTSDRSLSEAEQLAALESMMEDTEFEKLETAYAAGVTPGQYVEFKRATDGLSADKINGKTVSGSKKAKVLAAIDAMDITNSQKTALYYAAGYKQSTLDEAPWISGKSMGRSREDALKLLQGANSQPQDLTMPRLTDENGEVWNPFAKKSSDITMPRLVK